MPKARKHLISLQDTPYYHCMSRCVRRSFLCGIDEHTGKSYEHRRGWVEQRLLLLGEVFAIDVCAYAVMSNHTHIVLCVNSQQAKSWDALTVLKRWHQVYTGTPLTQLYCVEEKRESLTSDELQKVEKLVELYRERLTSISWFMRALNECIAREANKEDECTGHFWEGRFKSQALLDEQAILSCMAYVDLNPIRANMAKTPEKSDFTSIQARIQAARNGTDPLTLKSFNANDKDTHPMPCCLNEYLNLVEFTGRAIRNDKSGSIPENCPPLLMRLQISLDSWFELTQRFEHRFTHWAGRMESIKSCQKAMMGQRIRGSGNILRLFS